MDKPRYVNNSHFSTGEFPSVLAFCDRDNATHIVNGDEESYQYKLGYQVVYMLKKKGPRWEVLEFDDHRIIRVNTANSLPVALFQALSFTEADKPKQDKRVNILFPVQKTDLDKALAIMYYMGGYPGNFLPQLPELTLIKEKFLDPEMEFLSFSYVPLEYIEWLRQELKNSGILGEGKNRNLWIYKK
jgi:hypothetical protein